VSLRPLLILAGVLAVAGTLHLADHVIRGKIVEDHHLIAEWDHSGWPFRNTVTPFTPTLGIPVVFVGGIVLTRRGHVGARFWLVLAVVVEAVVVAVHFLPREQTETMRVIYRTYDEGGWDPVWGVSALAVVALIAVALAGLGALAVSTRRRAGHW
jgi:hypothetical protein